MLPCIRDGSAAPGPGPVDGRFFCKRLQHQDAPKVTSVCVH
jgi:hypothetical protein